MFNPMITILRNYTEIIVFIVTLFVGYCQCAVTITPQNAFVQGGNSLTIIATTDETSITWTYKSGESLSLCSITGSFCVDTNVHNMVLTADATTNTSTITIASVNCSINTAIFIAKTSNGEATANIQVTTPESSLDDTSILSTNSVPSQELSIEVPCVHPLPDVNFTIVREGKPNETIHDVTVSSTSSGCSCTTQATYTIKTTISASRYPGENVQVTANVGQLTPLVIGVVSFTGPTTTTAEISTERSYEQTTSHLARSIETTVDKTTEFLNAITFMNAPSTITTNSVTEGVSGDNTLLSKTKVAISSVCGTIGIVTIVIVLIVVCRNYICKEIKESNSERQDIREDYLNDTECADSRINQCERTKTRYDMAKTGTNAVNKHAYDNEKYLQNTSLEEFPMVYSGRYQPNISNSRNIENVDKIEQFNSTYKYQGRDPYDIDIEYRAFTNSNVRGYRKPSSRSHGQAPALYGYSVYRG